MSYDIRIRVKVEGCGKYVTVGYPEYDSPTYNLRDMFVACMDWDYSQGEQYPCDFVIEKVERGIHELRTRREHYKQYNPKNGWGDIDSAIEVLESVRECIYEWAEDIPIECLYFQW